MKYGNYEILCRLVLLFCISHLFNFKTIFAEKFFRFFCLRLARPLHFFLDAVKEIFGNVEHFETERISVRCASF